MYEIMGAHKMNLVDIYHKQTIKRANPIINKSKDSELFRFMMTSNKIPTSTPVETLRTS